MKWGGSKKKNGENGSKSKKKIKLEDVSPTVTVVATILVILYLLLGNGTFWTDLLVVFIWGVFEFFLIYPARR